MSSESWLNYTKNGNQISDYKIIEIWNIDTFEGGSVSRTTFLEKRCIEFEKKNKGNYFIVKNMTIEQAVNQLGDNKIPSMISFGTGFGRNIKNKVLPLYDEYFVRKDLMNYGKIGNILFAVPYILGGYSVIGEYNESFEGEISYFSSNEIYPENVLIKNDLLKNAKKENFSSFELYESYIKGNKKIILGTQRDVYRCINRSNNGGKISQYKILGGYSDLVQYISILDEENYDICNNLVCYLTSEECQKKLNNINMFNVLKNNYYDNDFYREFQDILNENLESINAFE